MSIGKNGLFDHVKLRETGSIFPVVFDIEDGYRRGGVVKTDDGEYVMLFGVSNTKSVEQTSKYKRQEGEKTEMLFGMIIHNKKEAEVLGKFFEDVANQMA